MKSVQFPLAAMFITATVFGRPSWAQGDKKVLAAKGSSARTPGFRVSSGIVVADRPKNPVLGESTILAKFLS